MTIMRIKLDEYEAGKLLDSIYDANPGLRRDFFQDVAKRFLELYDPYTGNIIGSLAAEKRYRDRAWRLRGSEPVQDARAAALRIR